MTPCRGWPPPLPGCATHPRGRRRRAVRPTPRIVDPGGVPDPGGIPDPADHPVRPAHRARRRRPRRGTRGAVPPRRGLRHPRPRRRHPPRLPLGLAPVRGLVPQPRPRTARRRSRHHRHVRRPLRRSAGFAVSSIRVHLAAIRTAHLLAGLRARPAPPAPRHGGRGRHPVEGRPAAPPGRPRRARRAAPDAGRPPLPRHARSAPATAPCCCWASAPRCAAPSWSALTLGDVETVPGRGLRAAGAPLEDRPARARARTSPSGPTRRSPAFCPARRARRLAGAPPHRPGPRLDRQRRRSRAERPLFCAVTKAGRVTGAALSDKAVARLVKQAALRRRARPGALLRALAARRARHRRRRRRRRPRRADAPDPPQIHRGRPRLPPPRRSLAQQRHRGGVSAKEPWEGLTAATPAPDQGMPASPTARCSAGV